MVHLYPLGQRIQENGVASMFAHVPLSFMNMSILDRPAADAADLRSLLTIARERATLCAHPSVAALCDACVPKGWESIASEEGFQVGLNITGMKAEALKPPRRPAPEVTWRRVDDLETARAIGEMTLYLPHGMDGFVAPADGAVTLRHILVPVTDSPLPAPAVSATARLIRNLGLPAGKVTLLHVGAPDDAPPLTLPGDTGWEWARTTRSGDPEIGRAHV